MKKVSLALLLSLTAFIGLNAHAAPAKNQVTDPAADGVGTPNQNEIWKYTYSPDIIFRIFATTKRHVHLELAEDEGLTEDPIVGDSIQWRVTGGPRHLYIKPIRVGIETTMTVVTNKRSYEFQLIAEDPSTKNTGRIFQKISFDYPEDRKAIRLLQENRVAATRAEEERKSAQVLATGIDPAKLQFTYTITGEASFKPVAAYCDDKFTYLVMPKSQDMPGIFLIEDNGTMSLVKFKPRDNSNIIVVERVAKKLLLQLGDAKVYVSQAETKKSWWQ